MKQLVISGKDVERIMGKLTEAMEMYDDEELGEWWDADDLMIEVGNIMYDLITKNEKED